VGRSTAPLGAFTSVSKIPIRTIAVLEIIGGLFSLGFIGWAVVTQPSDIGSRIIGFIALVIDVSAIVAGVTLWRGTSFGRKASMAIQAIQLPKIVSPTMIFIFSFGFDLWLHASASGFGIQTAFFGSNQLFLNVENVQGDIGISITAIIALVILNKFQPVAPASAPLPPAPPTDWSICDETAPKKSSDASGGSVNSLRFPIADCRFDSLAPVNLTVSWASPHVCQTASRVH